MLATIAITAAGATAVGGEAAAAQHNPKGRFLGIVQAGRSHGKANPQAPTAASNLTYHGGPVMHTNRTHAIYWEPSGFSTTTSYKSFINSYLGDVAGDSGKHGNVYASDVQYYDGSGNAAYKSTFAGAIVATDAYPASGCTDTEPSTSVCLSDTQIQAEVDHVVTANGLPRGLGELYLLMTPQGVGSCFGSGPGSCAYTDYCAYHSDFDFGAGETLYANQPYAGNPNCDSGEHPNGDVADSTINLISHEHNEAITDPLGTGWWDSAGNENGDKCAWNFGTALGSTSNGQYNQLINTRHYYLQQEWSNVPKGCVLTMPNLAPTASFTTSPPSPTTGQPVFFDGGASSDSDGTVAGYGWDFGDGTTGGGKTTSHIYQTAGTHTVKLTVTDNDGTSGPVAQHDVTVTQGSNTAPPGGGTTGGGSAAGGGVSPVFTSPTTPPGAGLTATAPRARVLIPSQRLRLSSSRATAVRVTCSSRVRCAGTLRIYVLVPGSAPRHTRSRTVLLGAARFSVAALRGVTVHLRLGRLAATLLQDHVRVRVRARALVTQAAAGSAAVERSVWLERPVKPKR